MLFLLLIILCLISAIASELWTNNHAMTDWYLGIDGMYNFKCISLVHCFVFAIYKSFYSKKKVTNADVAVIHSIFFTHSYFEISVFFFLLHCHTLRSLIKIFSNNAFSIIMYIFTREY